MVASCVITASPPTVPGMGRGGDCSQFLAPDPPDQLDSATIFPSVKLWTSAATLETSLQWPPSVSSFSLSHPKTHEVIPSPVLHFLSGCLISLNLFLPPKPFLGPNQWTFSTLDLLWPSLWLCHWSLPASRKPSHPEASVIYSLCASLRPLCLPFSICVDNLPSSAVS